MTLSTCALIDYGSGNLRSAEKALVAAAAQAGLNVEVTVTDRPEEVRRAEHIVLPGVGAFADCKAGLLGRPGLVEAIAEMAVEKSRPFLGICVGMQLLATRGVEHGTHEGLGWIPGEVARIEPPAPEPGEARLKVPHMGWNALSASADHPVLKGIGVGSHLYFVHSYHFRARKAQNVAATVDYGGPLVAAVARDNLFGTQFHPEKSQALGLRLLANFLAWRP